MASLNKIMLIGGVGKDPETRQFQDGGQVCNFSLATSETYTDRNGERKEDTTWHNIVLNGKLAALSQFIHKGSRLYVEGKIRKRTFQTQSGETKEVTEVLGLGVQLLDPKQPAQQPAPQAPPPPQPQYPAPPAPPQYQQPPMPPQYQQPMPPQPPMPGQPGNYQYPPMNNPTYTQPQADDLPEGF